jgi:hypothetical protein
MKLVKIRSPFVIQINEATQIGSKIELFIWNYTDTEPTTPSYTLSKPIPTTSQRLNSYNVSNFVREYIENIAPTPENYYGQREEKNEWCYFKVKRYWNNAGTYVLLDTITYVGLNGFSNYMDGLQIAEDTKIKFLTNTNITKNYFKQSIYPNDLMQYVNLIFDKPTATTTIVNIKFETLNGSYNNNSNYGVGFTGIFNIKIPISLAKIDENFIDGCKVTVTYTPASGPVIIKSFYTYPICEPKYTPVLCDFINRFGGWETLTLYKAQTNSISVKNEDYKLSPKEVNYNPLLGQKKSFNFIGTQVIKCNTGWVDENNSELITDLLLSEKVLIDKKPVILKTQGTELKTKVKNRLINYELEFEFSYNLINDAI